MLFPTTVNGIPCQCHVLEYRVAMPALMTGTGPIGSPEENDLIRFELRDRNGYAAPWLERYLTPDDTDRLRSEYQQYCNELRCSFEV